MALKSDSLHISEKIRTDLKEEVVLIALAVGDGFEDFDRVIDPFENAGFDRQSTVWDRIPSLRLARFLADFTNG